MRVVASDVSVMCDVACGVRCGVRGAMWRVVARGRVVSCR